MSYSESDAVGNSSLGSAAFSAGGIFGSVFVVTGTCIGCPSSTALFDSVTARRRLQQQNSSSAVVLMSQTTCLCPEGATQAGPTLQQFSQVLNESLSQLPKNSSWVAYSRASPVFKL